MKFLVLLSIVSGVLGYAIPKGVEKSRACAASNGDLTFTGFKAEVITYTGPEESLKKLHEVTPHYYFYLHLCSDGHVVSTANYTLEDATVNLNSNSIYPFNTTLSLQNGKDSKAINVRLARNKRASTIPFLTGKLQDVSIGGVFGSVDGNDLSKFYPIAELFPDPAITWTENKDENLQILHFPIYAGILEFTEEKRIASSVAGQFLTYNPNWSNTVSVNEVYDFSTDDRKLVDKVNEGLSASFLNLFQRFQIKGMKMAEELKKPEEVQAKKPSRRQSLFNKLKSTFNVSSKDSSNFEIQSLVLAKLGPKKSYDEYSEIVQNAFSQIPFPEQVFNHPKVENLSKFIGL